MFSFVILAACLLFFNYFRVLVNFLLVQQIKLKKIYSSLIPKYNNIEFGSHFHSLPNHWFDKINSAYESGCRRFDGAILGYGGCPMAKDELTGNIPTEKLLSFFNTISQKTNINPLNFETCYNHALKLFHNN